MENKVLLPWMVFFCLHRVLSLEDCIHRSTRKTWLETQVMLKVSSRTFLLSPAWLCSLVIVCLHTAASPGLLWGLFCQMDLLGYKSELSNKRKQSYLQNLLLQLLDMVNIIIINKLLGRQVRRRCNC